MRESEGRGFGLTEVIAELDGRRGLDGRVWLHIADDLDKLGLVWSCYVADGHLPPFTLFKGMCES